MVHVAAVTRCRRCVGIECVASRHQIAEQALNELQYEILSNQLGGGDGDGGDGGGGGGGGGGGPLEHVHFHFGDATVGPTLAFTHVYAFDRVFSRRTMRALARLLSRSPFRVFCSFRTLGEWWDCGLRALHPVARLRVSTTGGESMSIHVYANLRYAPDAVYL